MSPSSMLVYGFSRSQLRQARSLLLERPGVRREAHQMQPVLRKLGLDQGMQGQGHFLGRKEFFVPGHGPAHVQHEDDRRTGSFFRLIDLKIVGMKLAGAGSPSDRRWGKRLPCQAVHQRLASG